MIYTSSFLLLSSEMWYAGCACGIYPDNGNELSGLIYLERTMNSRV
jgi:hypothetical protein